MKRNSIKIKVKEYMGLLKKQLRHLAIGAAYAIRN
jgi:hypothetical protein